MGVSLSKSGWRARSLRTDSASPTTPIWKKWSITQMLAKPVSSAVLPISANFGPIESGASGQVKRGTCNPMRTVGPSVLSRDGSIASPPIVPTNRDILRASVSMHNSQHPVSLDIHALISDGIENLELVKSCVLLIIQRGLWYHKYYAHRAEVRASARHLSATGRASVDGSAT